MLWKRWKYWKKLSLFVFKECFYFFISMNVSRFDETFKLKKKKSFRRIKSIVEISPVGYFRCCVQWMEFKIVLWMDKNIKRCIQILYDGTKR